MQAVAELLMPAALVVIWVVFVQIAPDIVRSIVRMFEDF